MSQSLQKEILFKNLNKNTEVLKKGLGKNQIKEIVDLLSDMCDFNSLNKVLKQDELSESNFLYNIKLNLDLNLKVYENLSIEILLINKCTFEIEIEELAQSFDYSVNSIKNKEIINVLINEDEISNIKDDYELAPYPFSIVADYIAQNPDENILKVIDKKFILDVVSEKNIILINSIIEHFSKLKISTICKIIEQLIETEINTDFIYNNIIENKIELNKDSINQLSKFLINAKEVESDFFDYCFRIHFSKNVFLSTDFEKLIEQMPAKVLFNSLIDGEFAIIDIKNNKWEAFNEYINYLDNNIFAIKVLFEKNISDLFIVDYLLRSEELPDSINSYLKLRNDFIVVDPIILFRICNKTYLSNEVKNKLEKLHLNYLKKEPQEITAVKFQKYYHEINPLPAGQELSDLITEFTVLLNLCKNIDDSILNNEILNKHKLPDCEFDSEFVPLVSESKLSSLISKALLTESTLPDFILFAYENLPEEKRTFLMESILKHPSCPISILKHHALEPILMKYVILNQNTTIELLEYIVKNSLEIQPAYIDLIKKHPNTTETLRTRLVSGDLALIRKSKESEDQLFLDDLALKIYVYPNRWDYSFELSGASRCKILDNIVKNENSGEKSFRIYLEAFSQAIFQDKDAEVRKIVIKNKYCNRQIIEQFLQDSDTEFYESWILSDSFDEEKAIEILNQHFLDTMNTEGTVSVTARGWRNIEVSDYTRLVYKLKGGVFNKFINDKKNYILNEFINFCKDLKDKQTAQEIYKLFSKGDVKFYSDLINFTKDDSNLVLSALIENPNKLN
jgi:hypothetical protein